MSNYRLAARIMAMPAELPPLTGIVSGSREHKALTDAVDAHVSVLKDNAVNKVVVDDVAEFYATHEKLEWDMRTDVPNWAPPWGMFFVEWNTPPEEVWKLSEDEIIPNPGQCGLSCLAVRVPREDDRPSEYLSAMDKLLTGFLLMCDPAYLPVDRERPHEKLLNEAGWVILCDTWLTEFVRPLLGRPMWGGARFGIAVAQDGRYLRHVNAVYEGSPVSPNVLAILGLAISFFHCKNVNKSEKHEPAIHTGARKSPRPPAIKYTVLDVNPMKSVLRQEGGSDVVGMKKAMHICRGHFANYTSDAPLFGKHVGQFWVPDHVRGSREFGEVKKTYRQNLNGGMTDA